MPSGQRFSQHWKASRRKVYTLQLIRLIGRGQSTPKAALALGLFCHMPLALNAILLWAGPDWAIHTLKGWLWLEVFCLVNVLMLVAAFSTANFLVHRAAQVDDLLLPKERASIISWIDRRLRNRQQLILPLLGAIAGPLFVVIYHTDIIRAFPVGAASYTVVAVTSFIGGNVCYWLWTMGSIPRRIQQGHEVQARWYDPAGTPGIRVLADGYGLVALFLLFGAVLITIAGFVLPGATGITPLRILLLVFFALFLATIGRVGFYPYARIYWIIVHQKRASLAQLDAHIKDLDAATHSPWQKELLELYNHIASRGNMPFSMNAVVQYAAVLLGAIVTLIVGLVR